MSSPFVRRSTAITAGAVVLAGLVAIPAASFATPPTGLSGIPVGAIKASRDPDGAGTLYRLTKNVSTYTTVSLPNNATLNGAGHTITAVEDANHPVFPGPVVSAAVGTDTAAAHVDIKNLHITAQGFDGKDKNSGGKLSGIYMFRAGGTLTNVSVAGVWHDSGVQEGDAISVRNKVSEDPSDGAVNVPRARVALKDVHVGAFQKTGIRLDGNVSFAIENTTVGASALQHNPPLAPNGVTIMRGASGTVRRQRHQARTTTSSRPLRSCGTPRASSSTTWSSTATGGRPRESTSTTTPAPSTPPSRCAAARCSGPPLLPPVPASRSTGRPTPSRPGRSAPRSRGGRTRPVDLSRRCASAS